MTSCRTKFGIVGFQKGNPNLFSHLRSETLTDRIHIIWDCFERWSNLQCITKGLTWLEYLVYLPPTSNRKEARCYARSIRMVLVFPCCGVTTLFVVRRQYHSSATKGQYVKRGEMKGGRVIVLAHWDDYEGWYAISWIWAHSLIQDTPSDRPRK